MAIRIILISILFICLGTYNSIQAEIIRGVDVPKLNTTRIAGRWYVVTTNKENQQLECSTSVVTPQPDDSYTLNVTYRFTSEAKKNNPDIPNGTVTASYTATMEKDSSVIKSKDNEGNIIFWVMFDVDYDSHLAIYCTNTTEAVTSGEDGMVFIVSRQPTISEGIIEKVKQSNFYQQGVNPSYNLISLNSSSCI